MAVEMESVIFFIYFSGVFVDLTINSSFSNFPKTLIGCKIQFREHWDQSQPCSSNGFRATAVRTQGGHQLIIINEELQKNSITEKP